MRAICRSIIGSTIPPKQRYLGEADQTDYSPLKVGESYLVYAMFFIFDRVDFLVSPSGHPPFWVPSNLFDLVDAKVPAGWEFCITQSRTDYKALFDSFRIDYIVGYSLLVNDYQHYLGIVERESKEVQRFMEENLRLG